MNSWQFEYREYFGERDTKFVIKKDSSGNMSIAFQGRSPFYRAYSDVEMMRFIDGKVYVNIGDTLRYFGENPDSLGIPKEGWIVIPEPAEFNKSVLDMQSFFSIYPAVLAKNFSWTEFTDKGDRFVRPITAGEVFSVLKEAEKTMDRDWVPPIKNMIGSIKWKEYERRLLKDNDKELTEALKQAGIAEWQAKLLLSGAKTVNKSLLLYVYDNYLGDIKQTEDEEMRITSSGLQIYIGSQGTGELEIISGKDYWISFRLSNPNGNTAERLLGLMPYQGKIEAPAQIIGFRAFGPLLSDILKGF